jgi:hypothetical protein
MAIDPNNKVEERATLYPKDKDTSSFIIYTLKEDFVTNVFFVRANDKNKKELVAQCDFESTMADNDVILKLETLVLKESDRKEDFTDGARFFIKDVLDYVSKMSQLSDIKYNPDAEYNQALNQNINTPNSYAKNDGPKLKDVIRLVTPSLLMEELIDSKMVELISRELMADQVRYKFRIGGEKFNITMKSKETFRNVKAFDDESNYVFNDWRHQSKRGGATSGGYHGVNLLVHLMDYGVLKGETFVSDYDQYVKAGMFIKNNFLKKVEKRYGINSDDLGVLEKNEFIEGGSIFKLTHFDRLPLDNTSRISKYTPIKNAHNEWKNWLIDSRKLSEESVNELYKRKLIYVGQASISKKLDKVEPSDDRSEMVRIRQEQNALQENSVFKTQLNFIGLDKDGIPSFAEGLRKIFNKEKNIEEIKKQHLHKTSPFGSAFKLIQDNPKVTIISEAVIDGISAWDLFKMAGYKGTDFNIVATGGTSHMHGFFDDNFSLKIQFNRESKEMELLFIEKEEFIKELDEDRLKFLKDRLELWRFNYVTDASENIPDVKLKLAALEPIIGGSFMVHEQKDKNLTFWEKDATLQHKDLMFDYTNLDKFLILNGLKLEKNEDGIGYNVKDYYISKNHVELNDDNRKIVLSEIEKQFKTTSIALAYDNDEAGQKYFPLVDLLKEKLGIEVYDLTPKKLKISEGLKYQNKVDVNDILKTFKKYLENDVLEAQNLLEDFIQPYDPNYLCLDEDIKLIKQSFSKNKPKEKPSP